MVEGNAKQLLEAVGGELLTGRDSDRFRGVSINSRTLQAGELFICIAGERFDGHDFLDEAIRKEAAGIVLSNSEKIPRTMDTQHSQSPFIVRVADTVKALQDYAHCHRQSIALRVVGVTGTNGKSTTKEMIAAVAGTRFRTLKNQGNLNNHIGLPLTLFELEPGHELAVLEMGMSARGEIARLAEIGRPEIGVITNISEAHMVHLKSIKDVQAAKGELFQALGKEGTAIVNADDPLILELAQTLRARQVTFGIHEDADVRASEIRPKDNAGFDFTVSLFDKKFPLHLPFLGFCNIYNALAALATSHTLGLSEEEMVSGFANCTTLNQRLKITHQRSMTLINDTYNANPRSMQAAIEILKNYQTRGKRFFVMGEMLELGEFSQAAHARLGEEIAAQSIDYLVTVGEVAALAGETARRAGMLNNHVMTAQTHDDATDYLRERTAPGDCLLFKGSRGSQMEQVVAGLIKTETK